MLRTFVQARMSSSRFPGIGPRQAYAFLKYPKSCQNLEHTCWFCPQTLTVLAERLGLKVAHWELLEDYRLDDPSWKYRMFVRFFRWFIPRRVRATTMLFVLEKA